jgi:hypothetical protein
MEFRKLTDEESLALDEQMKEPEGGWTKPCVIADHEWELDIEEGMASLVPTNPHTEEEVARMDPSLGSGICAYPYWEREDLFVEGRIPVKVEHVDDSSPSTPAGPAEYGFYVKVTPLPKRQAPGAWARITQEELRAKLDEVSEPDRTGGKPIIRMWVERYDQMWAEIDGERFLVEPNLPTTAPDGDSGQDQ